VDRGFGTVVLWNVVSNATGGRDIQDVVDQPAEIPPGLADAWLS
jgi:hypothetical protein